MQSEVLVLRKVKKYLKGLGYPSATIITEYLISDNRFIDLVVKSNEGILIAIELKSSLPFHNEDKEEIRFHPITRRLQKDSQLLSSKYFICF